MSEMVLSHAANEQESGIWLSIGDLMSGLLLIFALLFITVLLQLQQHEEDKLKNRRIIIGTLIEELKGNNIEVDVNEETGDVSIRETILFDEDSSKIKPNGEIFLKSFIPIYANVIFSKPIFDEEISRVIIEGSASSKGTESHNMELSLRRALSVVQFIFDNIYSENKSRLIKKIIAAGRGESDAQQIYDDPSDRKVLFRFQFRGEEFISWLSRMSNLQTEN